MKKVLMLLAISAIALPAISAAAIDVNLRYGARGTEVSELQEFLIDKGLLSGAPTGNFYSLTRKAVIAYQTSTGLPATGFVGPMTRSAINQELTSDTSAQAEVAETGTTTPPLTESPIDLLKKQIALMMQQIGVLQGQATTQNQILQNQQTQQTVQNQQAQQTQLQLGQIVANTTPQPSPIPPAPPPSPVPTPQPPAAPAPSPAPVWQYPLPPTPQSVNGAKHPRPNLISLPILTFSSESDKAPTSWSGVDVRIVTQLEFSTDTDVACGGTPGNPSTYTFTRHCISKGIYDTSSGWQFYASNWLLTSCVLGRNSSAWGTGNSDVPRDTAYFLSPGKEYTCSIRLATTYHLEENGDVPSSSFTFTVPEGALQATSTPGIQSVK